MDSADYLHLQLRLEGKSVTGDDRLRQVEVVPGEEMPLMVLARLAEGQVISYFDESLPPELLAGLKNRIGTIEFPRIDPLLNFLSSAGIASEVGHYQTCIFPAQFADFADPDVQPLPTDHPLVQAFGFGAFVGNVYAIERGGGIVSACMSVRENGQCGEAWVYTDPPYRHHGFARQVVSAWARYMLTAGKVPFYSHQISNSASANLAKRLGLLPVFDEISISYKNV